MFRVGAFAFDFELERKKEKNKKGKRHFPQMLLLRA